MKKYASILVATALTVMLGGCVNPDGSQNNTGSGALIGGVFGALTGAAIGGHGHGGQDALIGMAAGALAGGLIGNSADREQEARLKAESPQTYARVDQGQPLSIADVKALTKAGISEDVIINQIKNSRTIFHLSSADIIDLRDSGVTDKIVNYMIDTAAVDASVPATSTVVVQQAPPPMPMETIVVAPEPDYVWIGGEWIWVSGGWIWRAGYWGHPPYGYSVWIGGRTWHDGRGWHAEHGHWR